MGQINFYVIKASLSKCDYEDMIRQDGKFIENKFFFVKDIVTNEFKTTYRIQGINAEIFRDEHQNAREKYQMQQIDFLIALNLIYKLNDVYNSDDYCFKMYLKTATNFDLVYCPNELIKNCIYYIIKDDSFVGPYYTTDNTSYDEIVEGISNGNILVPSKKQLFEQIVIAKAS